jgi:DNA-binding winged helix-turn-helix (wHTH) protein
MDDRSRQVYEFGEFRLDAADRLLFRRGEVVPVPPKAVETLILLVEHGGRVVSKDDLMRGVWADAFVEENNLNQAISALRKALGQTADGPVFIETVPKRGYRFVASVGGASGPSTPFPRPAVEPYASGEAAIEPVGGAMPLDSHFYVVRPADDLFQSALARHDSIVLVKGARQMGKTSLLARGLQNARAAGARVVLTDFQDLSSTDLTSSETLFLTLGKAIAEELDLDVTPKAVWDPDDSANTNFGRFMRRETLKGEGHVVWALDEVDRLFPFPYASEVFGLFRAWHNRRALDPSGPWRRLTMAMAYATEANLFITDINQSPFNVGTRLSLEDFTVEQVAELDRRYGSPLRDDKEVSIFYALVGGHPYLAQGGLHALARGMELDTFLAIAPTQEGPFADHLHRMYLLLSRDAALVEAVRDVLEKRQAPSEESFHRLRSAGVLLGDTAYEARPRCLLYAIYLERHLPAAG